MAEADEDLCVASSSWERAPRSPCAVPGTLPAVSLTDAVRLEDGGASSVVEDSVVASRAPRSSSTAPGKPSEDSTTAAVRTEGGGAAEAERPFASSSVGGCASVSPRALDTHSL